MTVDAGCAVVVGATGAVGSVLTARLAARGMDVVAVGRSAEALDSLAGPGAINAGLINLMKQISLVYGPRGVTVHTLVPGPTDTPRLWAIATSIADERGVAFDEVWAEYGAKVSLGRLPTVEEVAWAVELLLAPEADILHGTVLHLDAGGLRGVH